MDKKTVKMQARMYSLVAEIYAINARIEGMKASGDYSEQAFYECQQRLEELSMCLKEVE